MSYRLMLSDMRSPQVEILSVAARADTAEELTEMLEAESVEYYLDGQWGKRYRKGGPLEWFNPPFRWARGEGVVKVAPDDGA